VGDAGLLDLAASAERIIDLLRVAVALLGALLIRSWSRR